MADNKKESDKKPEGPRFDHLLHELLEKNDGVFIGEQHNFPALHQALVYLAPAMNVTTVSLEVTQADVDNVIKAKSLEDYLKNTDVEPVPEEYRPDEHYNLIKAYHKLGVKVLGHEDPDRRKLMGDKVIEISKEYVFDRMKKIEEELKTIEDPEKKSKRREELQEKLMEDAENNKDLIRKTNEMVKKYAGSDEAMRKRNEFAADYIKKNKLPGKVLVLGGAAHSQYRSKVPASKEKPNEKDGLDKRLGIPAITIEPSNDTGGMVGSTKVMIAGKDYEVIMPADLKKMLTDLKISGWPPVDGVPVLAHPNAQPLIPSIGPRIIPPTVREK